MRKETEVRLVSIDASGETPDWVEEPEACGAAATVVVMMKIQSHDKKHAERPIWELFLLAGRLLAKEVEV